MIDFIFMTLHILQNDFTHISSSDPQKDLRKEDTIVIIYKRKSEARGNSMGLPPYQTVVCSPVDIKVSLLSIVLYTFINILCTTLF